jgi:RNase adapter protein RapZ
MPSSVSSEDDFLLPNSNSDPHASRPTVTFLSFGYRYGRPGIDGTTADLFIDVRSLPNPGKRARDAHTGLSARLQSDIFASDQAKAIYMDAKSKVSHLLSATDVQKDITVAVGCEAGKHRSVATCERLARESSWDEFGFDGETEHREISKSRSDGRRMDRQRKRMTD